MLFLQPKNSAVVCDVIFNQSVSLSVSVARASAHTLHLFTIINSPEDLGILL